MHCHVHGYVDTHAGEHVVVLRGRLASRCSPGPKHSSLVLRACAELRAAIACTRGHHLQQGHCPLCLFTDTIVSEPGMKQTKRDSSNLLHGVPALRKLETSLPLSSAVLIQQTIN